MAHTFAIENNVPPPAPRGRTGVAKYPFREMAVGDSFAGPIDKIQAARGAAYSHASRHNVKFTVRPVGDQFRVWRVA